MPYCTDKELEQLSNARSRTYSLLARVFCSEPDEELWKSMQAIVCEADRGTTPSGGYALLVPYLVSHPTAPLTDLAVDYAATFLGLGPRREGAFPYESVYTSKERLMKQEALDEMTRILRDNRLSNALQHVVENDHVATEFAVLAHYSDRVLDCFAEGDRLQAWAYESERASFLRKHPMRWIPDFCLDVKRLAQTDFYRAFADIASHFLHLDEYASCEDRLAS